MAFSVNLSSLQTLIDKVESAPSVESPGPVQDAALSMSNLYHASMRQRYAEASDQDGTWVDLAESTTKQHRSFGDDLPHILHGRTGELQQSLRRDDPNHVLELSGKSCIEGTQDPKARFHQDGGGNLPRRQILIPASQETLDRMRVALVGNVRALLNPGRAPLDLADSDIESMFGIELEK